MASTNLNLNWSERRPRPGDICVFTHGYYGINSSRASLCQIGSVMPCSLIAFTRVVSIPTTHLIFRWS